MVGERAILIFMNKLYELGKVWKNAEKDLDIQVDAPFTIEYANRKYLYAALIHNFGSKNGMLLIDEHDDDRIVTAVLHGYGYSCIDETYLNYDKKLFMDSLNDWGWTSIKYDPPLWYTGIPWSDR